MEQTQDIERLINSATWYEQSRLDATPIKSASMDKNNAERIVQHLNEKNPDIGASLIDGEGTGSHRVAIKDEKSFLAEFPNARITELRNHDTRFRIARTDKSGGMSI